MNTKLKVLAAAIAMTSVSAHAVGLITGPASAPDKGSFPTYYQDSNGLALEHCLPSPGAELNSALCLIGPADVPNATSPISFPGNFPGETFFYAADSVVPFANGEEAILVMALEATFGAELPIPGDQILFARIRFRFVAPVDGTYKVIYPYGEREVEATAGERVFFTDDTGINCGLDFSCAATEGQIGPNFLRPVAVFGDTEPLPFYQAGGKSYIANPGVPTPVTGGSNGNIFRIEGPAGSAIGGIDNSTGQTVDYVETDLFTLVGRVNTAPLPSNISIEKSTYSISADGNTQIDVNVKAVKALNQPDPQLKLFGKNMPGVTLAQKAVGSAYYYGQVALDNHSVPSSVYVSDLLEQTGRLIPVSLVDQVKINQAKVVDDSGNMKLHVVAESSDKKNDPVLTAYGAGGAQLGQLDVNGVLDVPMDPPAIPPAKVLVLSQRGGKAELAVTTLESTSPTPFPLKTDDDGFNVSDSPFNVLGNDDDGDGLGDGCNPAVAQIKIVKQPEHGTVSVNAEDKIVFTQTDSVTGEDSFSYYLLDEASGNTVSNVATVTVQLSAGNLPPVANPDTASVSLGSSVTIPVLENDTDPEGNTLQLMSVDGGAAVSGNNVVFTPAATGVQTLTYTISDGQVSTTGTITVDVITPVVVNIATAEYRSSKRQWRIDGNLSQPLVGVVMKIYVDLNRNGVYEAGEFLGDSSATLPDGLGLWDYRSTTNPLVGVNGAPVKVVSSLGVERTGTLTVRR